jgi:hypothetical protein
MKARTCKEVQRFQDIPNVGPAMARDFKALGIERPQDLQKKDPYALYIQMSRLSGKRVDPCVLDTYIAVVDFMQGAPARRWYHYTKDRKKQYPDI